MLRRVFVMLAILMAALVRSATAASDWPMYGYDAGNTFWNREERTLRPPMKVKWRYRAPGGAAFDAISVGQGTVFLSAMAEENRNAVFAVNASSGELQWRFNLTQGGGAMQVTPAVSPDSLNPLVFFGGQSDDSLYAVNRATGREAWKIGGFQNMYSNSPKIAGGALFVNANGRFIRAASLNERNVLWELPGAGTQSEIAIEQNVLLQGGVYGVPLQAVDLWTGKKLWASSGRVGRTLAAWGGIVVAPYSAENPVQANQYFYRLDHLAAFSVRSGQKIWETAIGDDLLSAPLAIADGVVYAVSQKGGDARTPGRGILYLFDLRSGKLLRQRGDAPGSRIVIANDVLYACASTGAAIMALSTKTLETVWSAPIGGGCLDMVAADGRLYAITAGEVAAFESDVAAEGVTARGRPIFGTPAKPSEPPRQYSRMKALIIGISDYRDLKPTGEEKDPGKLTDLRYAHRDAERLVEFLRSGGQSGGKWEVETLIGTQATRKNVMESLSSALDGARADELIYLFFAGHARRGRAANEVYIMTYDADFADDFSGVEYEWVRQRIAKSGARNVVAFIDACRAGTVGFARGPTAPDHDMLGVIAGLTGFKAIFTAGRGEEASYEDDGLAGGVFTYFLLKGLRGDAPDRHHDGFVNVDELDEYLQKAVEDYTSKRPNMGRQHPSVHTADGTIPDRFPLAVRAR